MELQDVENMPAVVEQLDKGIKKSKQLAQKDPKSAKVNSNVDSSFKKFAVVIIQ